jgi:hypothetical protein
MTSSRHRQVTAAYKDSLSAAYAIMCRAAMEFPSHQPAPVTSSVWQFTTMQSFCHRVYDAELC